MRPRQCAVDSRPASAGTDGRSAHASNAEIAIVNLAFIGRAPMYVLGIPVIGRLVTHVSAGVLTPVQACSFSLIENPEHQDRGSYHSVVRYGKKSLQSEDTASATQAAAAARISRRLHPSAERSAERLAARLESVRAP